MPAAITFTDEELTTLQELTDEHDPSAAVRAAVTEFVRHARRMRLIQLSGQVTMDDNWKDCEAAELGDGSDDV